MHASPPHTACSLYDPCIAPHHIITPHTVTDTALARMTDENWIVYDGMCIKIKLHSAGALRSSGSPSALS